MPRLPTVLCLVLLLCCDAVAANADAFAGIDRRWKHYESPNFELYSAQGDRDSRDVLEHMELLRAMFLDVLHFTVRMPQPVTIYLFDREKDFNSYLPTRLRGGSARYAGLCTSFPDRTIISLSPVGDSDSARQVVYHEYIHYLFRIAEQTPAPWFNEGVAEVFSTMEDDGKWLQLGKPMEGNVRLLQGRNLVPFAQLFGTTYDSPVFRDSGHTGIFYAQSWVFIHYCSFGLNKIPPEKLSLFLKIAGSPLIQEKPYLFENVCKELLGFDYAQLGTEIDRYISSGRFTGKKVKRPEIAARSAYTVGTPGRDEAAERLAELLWRQTDSGYAYNYIHDLLKERPSIRLEELVATMALKEDQPYVAKEHFGKAVEMGTANVAVFRELARLESNALFSSFDIDLLLPAARTEGLRKLLSGSIQCAPEQSQGYEMLAWVEATSRKPDIANVNLVQQRFSKLNAKARTVLALALLRFHLHDNANALKILDGMERLEPTDWDLFNAEILRARIENRPVDRSKLPKTGFRPDLRLPSGVEIPR